MAVLIAFAVGTMFLLPARVAAQDHVAPLGELYRQVDDAAKTRAQNLSKVERFFSSDLAKDALRIGKIDPAEVQKAIPMLSDEELSRLANQTEKIQNDFAAGALTRGQVSLLILAAAIVIIVIVIAAVV